MDVTSVYFGECQRFCPAKMRAIISELVSVFCDLFPLLTVIDQMVLGPVSYPAKIRCTTVFAREIANFPGWGGDSPLTPPFSSFPAHYHSLGFTLVSFFTPKSKTFVHFSISVLVRDHSLLVGGYPLPLARNYLLYYNRTSIGNFFNPY